MAARVGLPATLPTSWLHLPPIKTENSFAADLPLQQEFPLFKAVYGSGFGVRPILKPESRRWRLSRHRKDQLVV